MRLVVVALLRELARHPWQLALTLFSIAAGVAIVVGVDIANESASGEFERANATVDGLATHRIVGGEAGLDQDVYRLVKVDARIKNAAPVVTATVTVDGQPGRYSLLGIDPLSDFRIRELEIQGNEVNAEASTISDRDWALFAGPKFDGQRADYAILVHGARRQEFALAGTLGTDNDEQTANVSILVTDLIWAQTFLGMNGRLSHIALRLQPDEVDRLRAILPVSVQLIDLETWNSARTEMTRAFRTNLTALSLLALVIAMFLVYSTISFQIVRRSGLFAQLRAAGVSGVQLGVVLFLEILLIALGGTLLGLISGALLATGLSALVTQTINALYYALAAPVDLLSGWTLVKGLLIGIAATIAASALPITQIARTSVRGLLVRSGQERAMGRLVAWSPAAAVTLGSLGVVLMLLSVRSVVMAFAGLFMVILSLALLAPWTINGIGRIARRWQLAETAGATCRQRVGHTLMLGLKMATMNMHAHLSRTAVAVAALTVAVSATLGVGLMIDSFRFSVERWMEDYLRADVYITSEAVGGSSLSPRFQRALRELEGVRDISLGTRRTLVSDDGPLTLFALDTTAEGFAGFQIIDQAGSDPWQSYRRDGEVLITEPLSRRLNIGAGDQLIIPTRDGERAFQITAVYRDYSSDRGLVSMDWSTYSRYFDSARVASAALYLDEDVDADGVVDRIRVLESAPSGLYLRSNRGLREASLEVFDQTFRITDVLRWLAMVVAVVGIVSALMALQLERAREYAVLKAIGFSRLRLAGQMLLETSLTGLWAGLLAVPMGFVLAIALINVINVRSFGWSMATVIDWSLVGQAVMLSILAAALAGIYPAWRLWRTDIASGLRDE